MSGAANTNGQNGCGLSVAVRNGGHFPCKLGPSHLGDCEPDLSRPSTSVARWSEGEFICHLLAVVEKAGAALTFIEALNVARSLIRSRAGLPPKVFR
jgi:hypothetical protein